MYISVMEISGETPGFRAWTICGILLNISCASRGHIGIVDKYMYCLHIYTYICVYIYVCVYHYLYLHCQYYQYCYHHRCYYHVYIYIYIYNHICKHKVIVQMWILWNQYQWLSRLEWLKVWPTLMLEIISACGFFSAVQKSKFGQPHGNPAACFHDPV